MFFFVALFGGAGIFGANQQDDSLTSAGSLSAPTGLSMALHSTAIHHTGRRLLSAADDAAASSSSSSSIVENGDVSTDSKAVALWQDLAYIHTNTNASSMCQIGDLLSSVVNATTLAQGTLMMPNKEQTTTKFTQLRGAGAKAVVPYSGKTPALFHHVQEKTSTMAVSTTTQHVLTSALTLQRQMAHHLSAESDSNSSTILCPKPYGNLNAANWQFGDDSNIVLLLPSSSISRGREYNDAKTSDEAMEWDGTWVEVDAKITAVRKLPLYTHQGISAPTNSRRAIPL